MLAQNTGGEKSSKSHKVNTGGGRNTDVGLSLWPQAPLVCLFFFFLFAFSMVYKLLLKVHWGLSYNTLVTRGGECGCSACDKTGKSCPMPELPHSLCERPTPIKRPLTALPPSQGACPHNPGRFHVRVIAKCTHPALACSNLRGSVLISPISFLLDNNPKSQLLRPPRKHILQAKREHGNPVEALELSTVSCSKNIGEIDLGRTAVQKHLTSLMERTEGTLLEACFSSGQSPGLSSLIYARPSSSFVVHTDVGRSCDDQRDIGPTSYPLGGMKSSDT